VASPLGAISRRERYVPAITRMGFDGKSILSWPPMLQALQ
jgi:hypothetical protein